MSGLQAQIPYKLSYQGLLTSPTGALAPDGSYNLKFEIYNHPTAGTLRFTETQTGVAVVRGAFSVTLGSVTTLTAIFSESLYVEVTALSGPGIGAPITFSPRSELTSAPYALAPWVPAPDRRHAGCQSCLYDLDEWMRQLYRTTAITVRPIRGS